jgi:hypothetical protein
MPWGCPTLCVCPVCATRRETELRKEVERLTRERDEYRTAWRKRDEDAMAFASGAGIAVEQLTAALARLATLEAAGTRAQGLEEAAKVAEEWGNDSLAHSSQFAASDDSGEMLIAEQLGDEGNAALEVADRIRALAQRGEGA